MGIFSPDGALARLLNTLGNLIVLNILTIICCVPVFYSRSGNDGIVYDGHADGT